MEYISRNIRSQYSLNKNTGIANNLCVAHLALYCGLNLVKKYEIMQECLVGIKRCSNVKVYLKMVGLLFALFN